MLTKFDLVDCEQTSSPIAKGVVLYRYDGAEIVDETTYKSIVGILIFLTHTNPYIVYLV